MFLLKQIWSIFFIIWCHLYKIYKWIELIIYNYNYLQMNRVKLGNLGQHKLDISFGFFDTHEKEKWKNSTYRHTDIQIFFLTSGRKLQSQHLMIIKNNGLKVNSVSMSTYTHSAPAFWHCWCSSEWSDTVGLFMTLSLDKPALVLPSCHVKYHS